MNPPARIILITLIASSFVSQLLGRPVDFSKIRKGNHIRLVLAAGGDCKGKVVDIDSVLSIRLLARTSACGAGNTIVTVRKEKIRDIVRTRVSSSRALAAIALIAVGVLAAELVGQKSGSDGAALATVLGGAAAGAYVGTTSPSYMIFVMELE